MDGAARQRVVEGQRVQPRDAEHGIDPGGLAGPRRSHRRPDVSSRWPPSPADPGMRRCGHGSDCRQSCQNAGCRPATLSPMRTAHRRRPSRSMAWPTPPATTSTCSSTATGSAAIEPHDPARADRDAADPAGPPITRIDGAGKTLLPGLDRRPRALHVRSDRGLDRGHPPALGRGDRAGRRRSRRRGPPGRRDDRPGRGLAAQSRGRPARRDRRRRGARSADPDGRHRGRHHRRARLPVRAGGGQPGGLRDRDAPGRPRRRGRGQGDRLGGGHAHDHRPRGQPDRQRRAGADASTSCGRSWRPPPSSASRS